VGLSLISILMPRPEFRTLRRSLKQSTLSGQDSSLEGTCLMQTHTRHLNTNADASQSTHKINESERQSELRHLSLQEFKAKFERENPERAAQLRYELLPAHEKAAIAHEKQQKDEAIKLEKALEQQKIAENTQKELARQKTWEISRDNDFEMSL
jgi:hypothetical protein